MNYTHSIFIPALVLILASCSPVKVVVDNKKDPDFSVFKTFSFQSWQDDSEEIFSEADKKLLRDSFISEFERRGFQYVTSTGDMQVSIYVVVNEETAFSGYNDYVGGRSGAYTLYQGGWGYGYQGNTSKQRGQLVGTLVMNIYSGSSKNQIWQAIATGAVNKNATNRDKTIPQTVSTIMRRFPVHPE